MPRSQQLTCNVCGSRRHFTFINARIESGDFIQMSAGKWKSVRGQLRIPAFTIPVAAVCCACGTVAGPVPTRASN